MSVPSLTIKILQTLGYVLHSIDLNHSETFLEGSFYQWSACLAYHSLNFPSRLRRSELQYFVFDLVGREYGLNLSCLDFPRGVVCQGSAVIETTGGAHWGALDVVVFVEIDVLSLGHGEFLSRLWFVVVGEGVCFFAVGEIEGIVLLGLGC